MKLFISKPKKVYAFQYGVQEEPSWFKDALSYRWLFKTEKNTILTFDLRGIQEASIGDWIVKDMFDGSFKFMSNKEFNREYEERRINW